MQIAFNILEIVEWPERLHAQSPRSGSAQRGRLGFSLVLLAGGSPTIPLVSPTFGFPLPQVILGCSSRWTFSLTLICRHASHRRAKCMRLRQIEGIPISHPSLRPEWYFLCACAIFRSIPNKLGGIIALLASMKILHTVKWLKDRTKSNSFYPFNQIIYRIFINNFILLTFMASRVIEPSFIIIRQILSINYFIYFIIIHYLYFTYFEILLS